jgi:hypothetical protein
MDRLSPGAKDFGQSMFMAWAPTPKIKMGQTFTANCRLPTADYFHDNYQ